MNQHDAERWIDEHPVVSFPPLPAAPRPKARKRLAIPAGWTFTILLLLAVSLPGVAIALSQESQTPTKLEAFSRVKSLADQVRRLQRIGRMPDPLPWSSIRRSGTNIVVDADTNCRVEVGMPGVSFVEARAMLALELDAIEDRNR